MTQYTPLPKSITKIIYQYCITQIDIDIESSREIQLATTPDSIAIEHIDSINQEENYISQLAMEQDILSRSDIISVSWKDNRIATITESDLYWGNY